MLLGLSGKLRALAAGDGRGSETVRQPTNVGAASWRGGGWQSIGNGAPVDRKRSVSAMPGATEAGNGLVLWIVIEGGDHRDSGQLIGCNLVVRHPGSSRADSLTKSLRDG